MPIVPLNFTSSAVFCLLNDGYDNLEVKCKIENNIDQLPIKFEFLDGKRMGVTIKKIRVKVSFSFHKSLSFTKEIVFYG